jgi:AraC family transcriptional regulator
MYKFRQRSQSAQYRADILEPRVLPDYEFVLIIEGHAVYVADGCRYDAPAGSILFTRPGFREAYYWDAVGPTRHAYFHFGIVQIPGTWPEFSAWPIVLTSPDPLLPALFRHVLNRIHSHQDWPAMPPGRLDCLIVETLLSLFVERDCVALSNYERDRPAHVNLAMNFLRRRIDTDPHERFSLAELAKASGVSEKHLCRTFRKSIGHSPMSTYRLLCMQLAISMLSRSNLGMREIADRCGFDDPAYFSRYFTNVFGCSPSQTRERLRSGGPPPASPLPVDLTPRFFW